MRTHISTAVTMPLSEIEINFHSKTGSPSTKKILSRAVNITIGKIGFTQRQTSLNESFERAYANNVTKTPSISGIIPSAKKSITIYTIIRISFILGSIL